MEFSTTDFELLESGDNKLGKWDYERSCSKYGSYMKKHKRRRALLNLSREIKGEMHKPVNG